MSLTQQQIEELFGRRRAPQQPAQAPSLAQMMQMAGAGMQQQGGQQGLNPQSLRQLRLQPQGVQAPQPGDLNYFQEFGRGLMAGAAGVAGGAVGTAAMATQSKWALDAYSSIQEAAVGQLPSSMAFTDIVQRNDEGRIQAGQTLDRAGRWAVSQAGSIAPIAGSIAAGGAAGAKVGALAGSLGGPPGAAIGAVAGSVTGLFLTGLGLYAGDIYGTARQRGTEHSEARNAALLYGSGASAVSILIPMGVTHAVSKTLGKEFVKRQALNTLAGAGVSAGSEGAAEAVAESLVIAGEEALTGERIPDKEKWQRVINAGAAGSLMGVFTGGRGGIRRKQGSMAEMIDAYIADADDAYRQTHGMPAIAKWARESLMRAESRTPDQESLLRYFQGKPSNRVFANAPLNRELANIQRMATEVVSREDAVNIQRAQELQRKMSDGTLTGNEAIELTAILANSRPQVSQQQAQGQQQPLQIEHTMHAPPPQEQPMMLTDDFTPTGQGFADTGYQQGLQGERFDATAPMGTAQDAPFPTTGEPFNWDNVTPGSVQEWGRANPDAETALLDAIEQAGGEVPSRRAFERAGFRGTSSAQRKAFVDALLEMDTPQSETTRPARRGVEMNEDPVAVVQQMAEEMGEAPTKRQVVERLGVSSEQAGRLIRNVLGEGPPEGPDAPPSSRRERGERQAQDRENRELQARTEAAGERVVDAYGRADDLVQAGQQMMGDARQQGREARDDRRRETARQRAAAVRNQRQRARQEQQDQQAEADTEARARAWAEAQQEAEWESADLAEAREEAEARRKWDEEAAQKQPRRTPSEEVTDRWNEMVRKDGRLQSAEMDALREHGRDSEQYQKAEKAREGFLREGPFSEESKKADFDALMELPIDTLKEMAKIRGLTDTKKNKKSYLAEAIIDEHYRYPTLDNPLLIPGRDTTHVITEVADAEFIWEHDPILADFRKEVRERGIFVTPSAKRRRRGGEKAEDLGFFGKVPYIFTTPKEGRLSWDQWLMHAESLGLIQDAREAGMEELGRLMQGPNGHWVQVSGGGEIIVPGFEGKARQGAGQQSVADIMVDMGLVREQKKAAPPKKRPVKKKPKPKPKPEPKPEPAAEAKPEPKPEPKPQPTPSPAKKPVKKPKAEEEPSKADLKQDAPRFEGYLYDRSKYTPRPENMTDAEASVYDAVEGNRGDRALPPKAIQPYVADPKTITSDFPKPLPLDQVTKILDDLVARGALEKDGGGYRLSKPETATPTPPKAKAKRSVKKKPKTEPKTREEIEARMKELQEQIPDTRDNAKAERMAEEYETLLDRLEQMEGGDSSGVQEQGQGRTEEVAQPQTDLLGEPIREEAAAIPTKNQGDMFADEPRSVPQKDIPGQTRIDSPVRAAVDKYHNGNTPDTVEVVNQPNEKFTGRILLDKDGVPTKILINEATIKRPEDVAAILNEEYGHAAREYAKAKDPALAAAYAELYNSLNAEQKAVVDKYVEKHYGDRSDPVKDEEKIMAAARYFLSDDAVAPKAESLIGRVAEKIKKAMQALFGITPTETRMRDLAARMVLDGIAELAEGRGTKTKRPVKKPAAQRGEKAGATGEPTREKSRGKRAEVTRPGQADSGADGGVGDAGGKQQRVRPPLVVVTEDRIPKARSIVDSRSYNAGLDKHQQLGVNLALQRFDAGNRGFMLADGTGVGKTRQILATADQYRRKSGKPVLIITNSRETLEGSFKTDSQQMGINLNDFEIGTYHDVGKGKVGKGDYGLVIFDEAHNLKNADTKKSINAQNFKTDHEMFVTATPMDRVTAAVYFMSKIRNMPEDAIYSRIGLRVSTEQDADSGKYKKTVEMVDGIEWDHVVAGLIEMRNEAISEGSMIRREYPFFGKAETTTRKLSPEQIDAQEQIYDYYEEQMEGASYRTRVRLGGQRSQELGRWTERLKIDWAVQRVQDVINAGEVPIVVAEGVNDTKIVGLDATLPGTLTVLSERLSQMGISHGKLFGKATKTQKVADVDAFQAGRLKALLMTAKSGGTGINLDDTIGNAPRRLIILTTDYSGDVVDQVQGRVSRRNTKSPSVIEGLFFDNSTSDRRRKEISDKKLRALRSVQQGVDPDASRIRESSELTGESSLDSIGKLDLGAMRKAKESRIGFAPLIQSVRKSAAGEWAANATKKFMETFRDFWDNSRLEAMYFNYINDPVTGREITSIKDFKAGVEKNLEVAIRRRFDGMVDGIQKNYKGSLLRLKRLDPEMAKKVHFVLNGDDRYVYSRNDQADNKALFELRVRTLPKDLQGPVREMRYFLDGLQAQLADTLGPGVGNELISTIFDSQGAYIHRQYQATQGRTIFNMMRKNSPWVQKLWTDKALRPTLERAIEYEANMHPNTRNKVVAFEQQQKLHKEAIERKEKGAKKAYRQFLFDQAAKRKYVRDRAQIIAQEKSGKSDGRGGSYVNLKVSELEALIQQDIDRVWRTPDGKDRSEAEVNRLIAQDAEKNLKIWMNALYQSQGSGVGRISPIFMERKELTPVLREALGEITDQPWESWVKSVKAVSDVAVNHVVASRLREQGLQMGWFSHKDSPNFNMDHTVPLFDKGAEPGSIFDADTVGMPEGVASEFTPDRGVSPLETLDGLYTTPAIRKQMMEILGHHAEPATAVRLLIAAGASIKPLKTVGNIFTAHVRNAVTSQVKNWGMGVVGTPKDYQIATKIAMRRASVDAEINRLNRLNVLETARWEETKATLKDISARFDRPQSLDPAGRVMNRVWDFVSTSWRAGDEVAKVVSFYHFERVYKEAGGVTAANAEQLAAETVNALHATYSHLPKAVQTLRRFPILGAFPSWSASVYINTKNQVHLTHRLMNSDNPKLRAVGQKMALSFAATNAATFSLSATYNLLRAIGAYGLYEGFRYWWEDYREEHDAALEFSAPWMKSHSQAIHTLPEGAFYRADLAYTLPYSEIHNMINAAFRADSITDAAVGAVKAATEPFTSQELLFGAVMKGISNNRYFDIRSPGTKAVPISTSRNVHGNITFENIMDRTVFTLLEGLFPGALNSAINMYKGARGIVDGSKEHSVAAEVSRQLTGLSITKVDASQGSFFSARTMRDWTQDAQARFNRDLRNAGTISDAALRRKWDAANKARYEAFTATRRMLRAAVHLGADPMELVPQVLAAGWSREDARVMLFEQSAWTPYLPSRTTLEAAAGGRERNPEEFNRRVRMVQRWMVQAAEDAAAGVQPTTRSPFGLVEWMAPTED